MLSLKSSSFIFTGLFTNYLLKSMTYRMVAVIGGMLFTVGIMLTTITHNVTQIVITYSIISGNYYFIMLELKKTMKNF